MPQRYNKNYLVMMSRDPHWLYVYWEITGEAMEKTQVQLGSDWDNNRLVLRVFTYPMGESSTKTTGDDVNSFDIDLPEGVESWYINAGRPDHRYQVAVGIVSRSGRFIAFAKSGVVPMPLDGISPQTDEEWTTVPETFKRLYEVAMPAGSGPMSQGHSSGELGLLLRERLRSDWSSGMLASMGSDSVGGGERSGAERGFWFILDAELIVYGATEPDASVTIQGRPIKLRPDGTFNLRFQLPDGTQVIDATAVSADKVFHKTITPTVRRTTRSTEMIESETKSQH